MGMSPGSVIVAITRMPILTQGVMTGFTLTGGEETEGTEGTQGTEEGGPELKGTPRICVGGHTQRWVEGRVLVFDDSFEHEAWNPSPHHPRAVLLLDVWHPDLGEAERDAIRRDFEGAREGAPAGAGWADGYRSSGHGRGPAPH